MKIVIDTNIVFSAILNSNSEIANLLFHPSVSFQFYSCNFMRFEIREHWDKLKRISSLSDNELSESQYRVYSKIRFIDEELIPQNIWSLAELLVSDIDPDDVPFVALTQYLEALLWTGDKTLYRGLKNKGFNNIANTLDVKSLTL